LTSAGFPDARRLMPLVHEVSLGLAVNPGMHPSWLRVTAWTPLLLRVSLPLWCRVLLI
jgi:hypothetical protein